MEEPKLNQNKNSLSPLEVERISSSYIRGIDKWYRMCAGTASNLERYENGIMYLRIDNSEKAEQSNYETALRVAERWMSYNEELREAKGFVVSVYTSGPTGFLIRFSALRGEEEVAELARQIGMASQEEKKLVNTFSGLFPSQE